MNKKRSALGFLSAMALISAVHATDWLPATRGELKTETAQRIEGDKVNAAGLAAETKARKDGDTQLGYEINTQAKYTTSVNADLQASKAAGAAAYNQVQGQLGNLGGRVDATEHRLDSAEGAIRDTQGAAQTANDRASALEVRADGSEAAIRETNGAVKSVDDKLNSAIGTQTGINGQVQNQIADVNGKAVNAQNTADHAVGLGQKGINDAYNAQVTANTAVGIGQDAKNTAINAQNTADYSVGLGQKNANDIVNTNNNLNAAVKTQAGVNGQLQAGINGAQGTANTALSNAGKAQVSADQANAGLVKTNTVVAGHTTQLANHEGRITSTESTVAQHTTELKQNQVNWTTQGQINNEYGQRLDNQDAMSSRFAADLGNVKSQIAGVQGQLNSQGKRIGQLENGLAGVMALSAIQFNTDLEAGFQIGCGVAQIRSNTGQACGAGGAITKNWFAAGYVMQASSSSGVAASATYSFGR